MNKINYKLVNLLIIFCLIFFITSSKDTLIAIFLYLKKLFLPILIAFIIAYFTNPLVSFFKKKGLSHNISFIITIAIIILSLSIVILLSYPIVVKQWGNMYEIICNFFSNNSIFKDEIIIKLEGILTNFGNKIYEISGNLISGIISFFTNAVFVIVLFFLFLYNFDNIKEKGLSLIKNTNIKYLITNIDNDIEKYIKSIAIIILIETLEYTLVYFLIGHPYFLLLGLLAGITTIIPFFGNLFTNCIALITAFSYSKKLFIFTSLVLLILPIFDNYVVDPKIYKSKIYISPIKTIIITTLSSVILGIFGIILAVPIYIILSHIIKYWYYKRKRLT